MRTTNATRNTAPETPKPIDKEFIGPGGHPIAEKNPKSTMKKKRVHGLFKSENHSND